MNSITQYVLDIRNLQITYGNNIPAVKHVSLHLKKGEILAIVGESGSGKTSVIRAVQDCLPAGGSVTDGEILFFGENLLCKTDAQKRALCGTRISMIFQDTGSMLNPIKPIGTQFHDYLQAHCSNSEENLQKQMVSMIQRVHLFNPESILHSYPFELSGGMRQRIGIAMAVSLSPDLLLADEPTSALDVTMQAQIVKEMMSVCKETGTSIIIVTHNLGVAAYMADFIMVMKNGVPVEYGLSESIIRHPQHTYTRMLLDAVPDTEGL